jgi:hypothetical protein
MSKVRVNNITNASGNSGTTVAGIPEISSNSHFVVPTGRTGTRYADGGENIVRDGLFLYLDAKYSYPGASGTNPDVYTWYDLSGNENNGVLKNGVGYSPLNGGSLVFDGVDSVVPLRFGKENPFRSNFTVEAWFYISEGSRTNPIIRQDASTIAPSTFLINYPSFNNLTFNIRDSSGTGFGNYRGGLSTNVWYHASMTVDFTALELISYLNGVPSTPVSLSGSSGFNLSTEYYIGDSRGFDSGSRSTLLGGISSTKVYNRALTAAEVLQNYNATKSRYGL